MPFTDYIQYTITVAQRPAEIGTEIALEDAQEIIISEISDMPFESFEIEDKQVKAYIQAEADDTHFKVIIEALQGVVEVKKTIIKGENWNQIWEESFDPITIDDLVIVKAPFHRVEKSYQHEIIIEPKMSFGTGHHSTTRLMMETMIHLDFKNKSVLDMGCGTGILAILANQLGAAPINAVDYDPQCIENTFENISLNNCQEIQVFQNEKISANFKTDIILANIQKNVLIEQMPLYKSWLNESGILMVSGIYEKAMKDVIAAANNQGLNYKKHEMLNEWCMVLFEN